MLGVTKQSITAAISGKTWSHLEINRDIMKSIPKLIQEAQVVFNEFIRLRDASGSHFKCISCDEIKPTEYMEAGHFYSTKLAPGLRYNEDNCHGQCHHCNCFLYGNLDKYAVNLVKKIGPQKFSELVQQKAEYTRTGHKWSRTELIEIIEYYKQQVHNLKAA